jgi:simple sugar transport system permease protein
MAVNIFAPGVAAFVYRVYFGISSTMAQDTS